MSIHKNPRIVRAFTSLIPKSIRFLYELAKPKSRDENLKKREFLLNILLLLSIALIVVAILAEAARFLFDYHGINSSSGSRLGDMLLMLLEFIILYFLSRKGYFILSASLLAGIYFLLGAYMPCRWGIDAHVGLLLMVWVVMIYGIVISSRLSFVVAAMASLVTALINRSQCGYALQSRDVVIFSVIFGLIATASWLSNREIEELLMRIRRSKEKLKKERGSLEMMVEKRTREMQEAQMAEIAQLCRFAEFGRLSAGLFHDLINPLNAVSLNMDQFRRYDQESKDMTEAKKHLDRAILATKKMEDLVTVVKKQISFQENIERFSLDSETKEILDLLSYKIKRANVSVKFTSPKEIIIDGNKAKFSQVVLNLVSNAIDAYDAAGDNFPSDRKIDIRIKEKNGEVRLVVSDNGSGISEDNLSKIFNSYFTTKPSGKGMGIGLSIVKRIVESDFHGSINVKSQANQGTTFIIKFPTQRK